MCTHDPNGATIGPSVSANASRKPSAAEALERGDGALAHLGVEQVDETGHEQLDALAGHRRKATENAGGSWVGHKNSRCLQGISQGEKFVRFPGNEVAGGGRTQFDGRVVELGSSTPRRKNRAMADGRTRAMKASCENCFFHQNSLCA